jgi:hypothetical protein
MAELIEVPLAGPTIARKSLIDEQAEEIRSKRELPKKPGDRVAFKELVEWLAILSEEQLTRLNIYVYRLEPIIIRQITDPEADNNIDVLYDVNIPSVTEQYFIDRHGGGKYRLIVKDMDKPKTQKGGFFEAHLYIPMTLYPPKLDLREVDWTNSHNKGFRNWARSQGMIGDDNVPTIEKKEGPQQNSSDQMVQAMKLAMDFASKMDEKQQNQLKRQMGAEDNIGKSISEIFLEKMKQEDPNKQLQTLTTMLTAIKSMQPDIKPVESGLTAILPIFTSMMESSKQQFMMMMEVLKNQNARPEGPDEIERMKSLMELAKMMKGGPAPERSTAEIVVDAITPIIGPVLSIVGNIVAMNAAKAGVGSVPAPAPTQTQPVVEQPPKQIGGGGIENPMLSVEQKQGLLKQFSPLITKALESSKEGCVFAQDIENLFGPAVTSILVKDGADSLIGVAKGAPEFWNPLVATYGEPHIVKWVTSFVNYKEELEKMEMEEEGEDNAIIV